MINVISTNISNSSILSSAFWFETPSLKVDLYKGIKKENIEIEIDTKEIIKANKKTPQYFYFNYTTERRAAMPDNASAIEKIKKYLVDNNLKQVDLAITYGKEPQDVANILAGRKKDPASNRFVLKVISDLKIR